MVATKSTAKRIQVTLIQGTEILRRKPTEALPPLWQHAYDRIHALPNVTPEMRERAWKWLGTWRDLVSHHHRFSLPAPFVFANDFGQVELEWETPRGELLLRLFPADQFQYCLVLHTPQGESEEEGTLGVGEVCQLLSRLLG